VTDFTGEVLAWGVPRLRDLPWRRTRDPWAVLVSEVMLQQTQVARVIPKWEAFLDRFPDVDSCAAAPLGDVLREWQGLGYPRRARNLHATAQQVSQLGSFPRHLDGLLALPGIGHYTARAVMAFAFELDAAVADTNIARLYARVAGERLTPKQLQAMADEACPSGDAWAWNQCLMDLGAVLCRPTNPACDVCPVVGSCAWHHSQLDDPAVGSSGVSRRQARFEGSDRQARGRLLKALTNGPVARSDVAEIMGREPATAERLVQALCDEGLCQPDRLTLRLPS
jgi:A/G-specific adenine glycosylase